ncbi:MAG: trypsin-like peptidase domain-containing protein [Acidobacteria bacterium]|nr:trypsin-like peptidase domain-containing protein [Acidobacteriota bacterium]MCA1627833.1 trypsin-like peptidase domain-containing protein [Acidobacteriota bacterium]
MYRLSTRQLLLIALISGLFAAGIVTLVNVINNRYQPSQAGFSEALPAGITDPATSTDEQNNIDVYRTLSPGVVFIHSTTYARDFFGFVEQQQGSGSGSILDQQGNILTNYHVIENAQKLSVSLGGKKDYPAVFVGGDPDTDLAVIRLTEKPAGPLTVVPFGDSEKLVVGQKVLAIGNPFGLDRTLTTGVISGLQRPIRARNNRLIEGAIQTDASINPGNSGGPLLDSHGRMIGINSQILSPSGSSAGVGFAVPVGIAKRVVPEILKYGQVRRPKLGISTRDVAAFRNQVDLPVSEGVLIIQVARGGGAAAAGLRGMQQTEMGDVEFGDIIVGIDNDKVGNSDELFRVLDKHQIGETVQVHIWRNGRQMSVPVRLTESRTAR